MAINKWDLIAKNSNTIDDHLDSLRQALKYIAYAPVITISSLKGTRVPKLFGLIENLNSKYRQRIGTAELNRFLEQIMAQNPPGMHRKTKRIKIYYLTQVRVAPPTFNFFSNYPESIHFSYKRFLENKLRETFEFNGAPLRLIFKKRRAAP